MAADLILDPSIRNYVLLPVIFVVFVSNIIRMNLSVVFGASKPPRDSEKERMEGILTRSRNLRRNGHIIANTTFEHKRLVFTRPVGLQATTPTTALENNDSNSKNNNPKTHSKKINRPEGNYNLISKVTKEKPGVLWKVLEPVDSVDALLKTQQDMGMMTGMLKSQFLFLGIHGTLGYWITHMFSGFLVARTPFPLTHKMKGMLQRGIDVPALNNSYVSSLSLYFLISFGTSGLLQVYQFMRGESDKHAPEPAMMEQMVSPPMPIGPTDYTAAFKQERESLEVHRHHYSLENIEESLLQLWYREEVAHHNLEMSSSRIHSRSEVRESPYTSSRRCASNTNYHDIGDRRDRSKKIRQDVSREPEAEIDVKSINRCRRDIESFGGTGRRKQRRAVKAGDWFCLVCEAPQLPKCVYCRGCGSPRGDAEAETGVEGRRTR